MPTDPQALELLKRIREQRRLAYGTVTSATGWRLVMLDLLALAGEREISGDRAAGRYDTVATIIKRSEGPLNGDELPEVRTTHG